MAVKETNIKADEVMKQRKTLYRALSENFQSALFFWHGVALFCFAFALGFWARGDMETQKELEKTQNILNTNNIYNAQSKAEISVLKKRLEELEK